MAAKSGSGDKSRTRPVSPSRADLDTLNSPTGRGEIDSEGNVDLSGRNDSLYRARYFVNRPFAWEDVWYTRDNADQIEQLPAEVKEAKLADGSIVDNHAKATKGE
jgi:hypothetical protein